MPGIAVPPAALNSGEQSSVGVSDWRVLPGNATRACPLGSKRPEHAIGPSPQAQPCRPSPRTYMQPGRCCTSYNAPGSYRPTDAPQAGGGGPPRWGAPPITPPRSGTLARRPPSRTRGRGPVAGFSERPGPHQKVVGAAVAQRVALRPPSTAELPSIHIQQCVHHRPGWWHWILPHQTCSWLCIPGWPRNPKLARGRQNNQGGPPTPQGIWSTARAVQRAAGPFAGPARHMPPPLQQSPPVHGVPRVRATPRTLQPQEARAHAPAPGQPPPTTLAAP
jgi:hypothetical protein